MPEYAVITFSPDMAAKAAQVLNQAAQQGFRVIDVATVAGQIVYTLEKLPQRQRHRRGR